MLISRLSSAFSPTTSAFQRRQRSERRVRSAADWEGGEDPTGGEDHLERQIGTAARTIRARVSEYDGWRQLVTALVKIRRLAGDEPPEAHIASNQDDPTAAARAAGCHTNRGDLSTESLQASERIEVPGRFVRYESENHRDRDGSARNCETSGRVVRDDGKTERARQKEGGIVGWIEDHERETKTE
jgi:hypothetical protein